MTKKGYCGLLTCPFCGAHADTLDADEDGYFFVHCRICYAQTSNYKGWEEADKAWNMRISDENEAKMNLINKQLTEKINKLLSDRLEIKHAIALLNSICLNLSEKEENKIDFPLILELREWWNNHRRIYEQQYEGEDSNDAK